MSASNDVSTTSPLTLNLSARQGKGRGTRGQGSLVVDGKGGCWKEGLPTVRRWAKEIQAFLGDNGANE